MPKKRQNRLAGIGFGIAKAGPIDQGRQRVAGSKMKMKTKSKAGIRAKNLISEGHPQVGKITYFNNAKKRV